MTFCRELATALVTGALKVRAGRFEGLPLFIALLVPLYDMIFDLLRRNRTLSVRQDWYPRDLACPPPCCDGQKRTDPPADGWRIPLRPYSSTSEWCERVGVAPARLGGRDADGLDLAPRKRRTTSTVRDEQSASSEKATRIVREHICGDFIRTYIFVMVTRQKWKLLDTAPDAMAPMVDTSPRRGFVHELALEMSPELTLCGINGQLDAHYKAVHGSALPSDITLELSLDTAPIDGSLPRRKRQRHRTALLAIQNQNIR